MEPYAKFNLLKQLNIKSIIAAAGTNDMEFFAKVGKLTDTMGVELLSCMDTVLSTTNGVQNGAPNHGIYYLLSIILYFFYARSLPLSKLKQ